MNLSAASQPFLIEGDGEMASLIRNHDWSSSAIGSMQYWPRNLLGTIDLLINSAFPMFLFWGKDHICFYNDAFRPALGNDGKHPTALGSAGRKVWHEIWPTIEPMINLVLAGRGTELYEDLYLPIYRNGQIDDAYWTFSYNPIKNDEGKVEGVLAIVHETTSKVKEKKIADILQRQFELALEAGDLGTFDFDPGTMRISCNQKTREVFGLAALDNIDLETFLQVIHPDDTGRVREAIERALRSDSGGHYDIEYTIRHPASGDLKYVRVKGKVQFDASGLPVHFAGTIQDITSEKRSVRRKKKLQELVENSNDFMAIATLDGQVSYINAAGRKLVGIDPKQEMTGVRVEDFYDDEGLSIMKELISPALLGKGKWNGPVMIRHQGSGQLIPCFGQYQMISDPDTGEVISRGLTLRDLRPELVARKELEESEKRFRNLVQEAPVATAIYIGREMKIQWANDAMIKMWGKDRSVVGKTVREALPELEGQPFHSKLDDVFTTGVMYQGTEDPGQLIVNGVLQTFYFNFSYKPLRDTEGKIYGILNMAIDVTESVNVKRKLEESERNFRNLIMKAPVGIALLTGDDNVVELANDQYLGLVGRERDSFIGQPIWELIPEAREQGFDLILQKVKDTGEPFFGNEIPVMLVRNNEPETFYLDFVYEPLFDEEHRVYRILVIAINVTRQVNARRLVESAEERTRLAIESASLGAYEVNLKTKEVHGSQRFNELFDVDSGFRREDYIRHVHPDDLETRQKAHDQALQTGTLEYECRIVKRDGTQNWIDVFGQYYFDGDGNPEKIIGIVKDITIEKMGEQELEKRVRERTEELTKLNEELQQFTYVSSHDLKEPLRKIQVFTGMIRDKLSKVEPELLQYSEKVIHSTQRMATLLNDLLNYSSLSDTRVPFTAIDLNKMVKDIIEDVEVSVKEKNALIEKDDLPVIMGIPFQVNQLFYNLINNAIKFARPGISPHIHIRCSEGEFGNGPSLQGRNFYKFEVIDNGIGFDQEYAEKIFVVFQRLHPRHEYSGNGIGLSICKKIVQNHKGHIYAISDPDKGSRFVVLWNKDKE